ncbi:uncharacterized protein [Dermacentor albipictus]|uniref:uncharacterized protein n=1 Tax=Dermacentor albipictus TaxID=60249 RepID=UPI0038FC22DF
MPRSANQVPLRHRRPKICAEMDAAAATRDWSPLEVYWDPRYQSYFYAGATPAASGQQTPQVTEFEFVGLDQRDPRVRPIIAIPGGGGKPKGRRISWCTASSAVADPAIPAADDTRRPGSFWTIWIMAVLVVMLLLVFTVFVTWFWKYLKNRDAGIRDNEATDSAIRWRNTANGAPPGTDEEGAEEPGDEGASLFLDFHTTDLHIAGKPSKAARPRHGTTELTRSICLYTHRDDVIDSFEITGQKSMPAGSEHCDLLIRCCYLLHGDMTLRPEASRTGVTKSKSRNHGEATGWPDVGERHSPTTLVAVRERDAAFPRLLATGGQRARADFARNALLLARSERFAGLRLWWPESHGSSVVARGFVRAVRHLAAELQKAGCTLGFFLPYAAAHAQPARYAARVRVLEEVLGATASLLLYPTTSVLGNVSEWPSPSRMMAASEKASGFTETPPGRSLCHLLPPVAAVSVVLANASDSCDANAIQRVLPKASFLSHERLSKLCRSWHSEWKVSRHRYHSYACGFDPRGRKGLVFQTPPQQLRHRTALLARTRSKCFGFVEGRPAFPRDCYKSPLLVSER